VSSFKYLGLEFFKNGNWSRSQERIADHAAFALHKLYIILEKVDMKVSDIMVQLFESLVGSILLYASEVWGFHEANTVDKLVGMYGELGLQPCSVLRKFRIIKYWANILQHQNSVQFKIYQMLKEDANRGDIYNDQNWAHQVILEKLGLRTFLLNKILYRSH
jgi:hypothetical protein